MPYILAALVFNVKDEHVALVVLAMPTLDDSPMNTSDADTRRAKVTEEHLEEARRLKAIWNERKDQLRERGYGTQLQFGLKFGIGSQAAVGFFLNGQTPLSLKAARGFAEGLGCKVSDFSPRLAALMGQEPARHFDLPDAIILDEAQVGQPAKLSQALLSVAIALTGTPDRKRKLIAAAASSMIEHGPNEEEAGVIAALAPDVSVDVEHFRPKSGVHRSQNNLVVVDAKFNTARSMAEHWPVANERDFLLSFFAAVDTAQSDKDELHALNSPTNRGRAARAERTR